MTLSLYTITIAEGDGTTVDFDFDLVVDDKEDVAVQLDDEELEYGEDYSVVLNSGNAGGTVTFNEAPEDGVGVFISRATPRTQETDILNQGGFQASVLMAGLDRLAMIMQELDERSGRALTSRIGSSNVQPTVLPEGQDGRFLAWAQLGNRWYISNVEGVSTFTDTYIPTTLHTYSSALRRKLEWDTLSVFEFLTETQRNDTIGNDCWEAIQNALDFFRDNQPVGTCPHKHLWLNGKALRTTQMLDITGTDDGGPREGRTIMALGSLIAGDSWEDQSSSALPLVRMSGKAQSCGLWRVYVDCNLVCSGVLGVNGDTDGSLNSSKYIIEDCVIVNFYNPQKPSQSDLYNNLIDIGAGNMASKAPARRYETSSAHPYGVRIGPSTTGQSDHQSATSWISGNHIRQFEFGRPELTDFTIRTGIGIWLQAQDNSLEGKTNHVSDVLKGLVLDGYANFIKAYHCSPCEGSDSFDANKGPTSDVIVIGTENRSGINYFSGIYHERQFWSHDDRFSLVDSHFPRREDSTSDQSAPIILDATEVDQEHPDGRPYIDNIHPSEDYDALIVYREEGGNWLNKVNTAILDPRTAVTFCGGSVPIVSSGEGSGSVRIAQSSHADRATWDFVAKNSTKTARVGIDTDRLIGLLDNTPVFISTLTSFAAIGGDGNRLVLFNSRQRRNTDFSKVNDTLASVFTDVALLAATKYDFRAILLCSNSDAGPGFKASAHYSATVTNIGFAINILDETNNTVKPAVRSANDGSASTDTTTSVIIEIFGTIQTNAAGDFNIQFAQKNVDAAHASLVITGSFLEVKETT